MMEMEQKEGEENGKGLSSVRVIAVAVNGGSKSKHIVNWALENFGDQGPVSFKLIHVFSKITGVPTPMGNLIPLPQVRDDIVAAFKKEIEWQKNEMILPYQRMLTQKKVLAEVVLLESDEIWNAISKEIAKEEIKDLVIGASSNSLFTRKFRGKSLSSLISESAPSFSTVYVVSKGKLEALRASDTVTQRTSVEYDSSAPDSTFTSSRFSNSSLESSFASLPGPVKNFDPGSKVNNGSNHPSIPSPSADTLRSKSESSESWLTDHVSPAIAKASTSTYYSAASVEEQQEDVNSGLEKLRIELRHIHGMYSSQNETKDATMKLSDRNWLRHEEGVKPGQIKEKEEISKVFTRLEKEKFESAQREAEYSSERALTEAFQRREAELKGARVAKQSLKKVVEGPMDQFQTFTWEEIVSATYSFSQKHKIGEGSYGTVYKCKMHRASVAIKVLHSKERAKSKHFLQEMKILSKIRHPYLLSLLGACPEKGCLVYEYMKNGSLQDHLFRKNDTSPLPWYERFRIVWEVALALSFLHNNKPNPIIHGGLKTANILLDDNFVSKISDTGLFTKLNFDPSTIFTKPICIDSNISVKDDIYALGLVILQMLTAKPDEGLTQFVEGAIKERRLMNVLDKDAGKWPSRGTAELALLGVQCAGIKRNHQPDLQNKILPVLERIKDVAEMARDSGDGVLLEPPSHFICPILMNVMEDPCVASDGYTYDRKAIELWVKDNDTSPTTNFPLTNKLLITNYSLLYAITEWKSKRKLRTEKPRLYSSFSCF